MASPITRLYPCERLPDSLGVLKMELTQHLVPQILDLLTAALAEGRPIERILRLKQSVDSLEGVNRQQAQDVAAFRDLQGSPPAAEEGQIVVVTADCKGIVIRGQGTPTVCGGERPAGQRANQKRMATVGAVYTVAPYVRTPAAVVAALFRDPDYEVGPRPQPCHKRVWASLPHEGAAPRSSIDVVFDWLWWEFAQRNPQLRRRTVCLCDGQEALWTACAAAVADED